MTQPESNDWLQRAIELEDQHDGPIGAGVMLHRFEKFFENLANAEKRHLAPLSFYYFVHYSRRKRQMSVADLAQQAEIEFKELMSLERDTQFKLGRESVVKLAKFFCVDENALIKLARLDKPHFDPTWEEGPIQFPEKVASTGELSEIERVVINALEDFLERHIDRDSLDYAA